MYGSGVVIIIDWHLICFALKRPSRGGAKARQFVSRHREALAMRRTLQSVLGFCTWEWIEALGE